MDIKSKAEELLMKLANSIYDREQQFNKISTFSFSAAETQIVEDWLKDLLK